VSGVQLTRPKLLGSAANHYADLAKGRRTRSLQAVLDEESDLEDMRQRGSGDYRVMRHIEVLGEFVLIQRKERDQCTS